MSNAEEIWKIISEESAEEKTYFKYEPMILHIACETINDATSLLIAANKCGFGKSSIISVGKTVEKRITVEINAQERLQAPVYDSSYDNPLIADKGYVKALCSDANTMQKKNWDRMKRLEESLRNLKKILLK